MRTQTGLQRSAAGPGFTLIELLLATALLTLLAAAVVFSFSSMQRGAGLDEGAAQVEALLRYARAQAASTGRQVQITFEDESELDDIGPLSLVRVTWEPDPLAQPGVFKPLKLAEDYVGSLNYLVQVESVQAGAPETSEPPGLAADQAADPPEIEADFFGFFPPIRFYPDGSSDSAQIVLSSRSEDDPRRVAVRLVGITGAIRRTIIEEPGEAEARDDAERKPPPAGTTERPVTVQSSPEPARLSESP